MATRNALVPNTDPYALAKQMSGFNLIEGALVPAISGKTFAVHSPATRKEIGRAALGEKADVDAAVAAAMKAQQGWSKLPARQRGKLLTECGRVLSDHVEELAR